MATCGYTTVGSGWGGAAANYKQACIVVLEEDADSITKITAYVRNNSGSAQYCRMALYADSSGVPGALVYQTEAVQLAGSAAAAWVDFAFTTPFARTAAQYWNAFMAEGDGPRLAYDWVSGAWRGRYNADTYSDGFSDPFGSSDDDGAMRHSSYFTYTTAAPGNPAYYFAQQ